MELKDIKRLIAMIMSWICERFKKRKEKRKIQAYKENNIQGKIKTRMKNDEPYKPR
jgi:hypothetical protein